MFALKRKSGHVECSPRCSEFEKRTHTMLVAPTDGFSNRWSRRPPVRSVSRCSGCSRSSSIASCRTAQSIPWRVWSRACWLRSPSTGRCVEAHGRWPAGIGFPGHADCHRHAAPAHPGAVRQPGLDLRAQNGRLRVLARVLDRCELIAGKEQCYFSRARVLGSLEKVVRGLSSPAQVRTAALSVASRMRT
jgi:hypothetical protein